MSSNADQFEDAAVMEAASRLDKADRLASFRDEFHIPVNWIGEPVIYFCGNSLGLQPKSATEYVEHELRQWREIGVEGHFSGSHPWVPYHEFVAEGLARVVGAMQEEVVAMNSLTVNLHLMMVSFFRPTPERSCIAVEHHAFPSDRYAAASQLSFHGLDPATNLLELRPREGEHVLRTDDVLDFLSRNGDSIALLLLGGLNYYTGQLFDMERITEMARQKGCVVGLDLAHAVGNVPLALHDWNVDFAVWCTYKYLNAGPGSTGGVFVHQRHHDDAGIPRFAGWWGHDKESRFSMPDEFSPILSAEGWQLSNSSILPLAALRASLEIFDRAGMEHIRQKSVQLTNFLEEGLRALESDSFQIITPDDPTERGAQLSLLFPQNGRMVFEALVTSDVVCDFREPGVIRVAPAPLYNTFSDVARFVRIMREVV